jgi:hypothetical protein
MFSPIQKVKRPPVLLGLSASLKLLGNTIRARPGAEPA